ncbi:MAG: DUF3127 domain-containing protein [Flavobacteriales bacterium]|nr:DUF3127 domain-containing protein [Flavobacteriales bacterium]
MAQVTITGTIKVVGQTVQVSEKFSKREIVITEQSGQYPQLIRSNSSRTRPASWTASTLVMR